MNTLSRVVRAVEWRLGLRGEGTEARHGRSDGFIMGGHGESSMQRLSMEGVQFKRFHAEIQECKCSNSVHEKKMLSTT